MEKSERFGMVLSPEDKDALELLAARERIPAAAVLRRLIWQALNGGQPVEVQIEPCEEVAA